VAIMTLDYRVPPEDLAAYVTVFYSFRSDAVVFEDVERAARAQLRFRLTPGRGFYRFPDGTVQEAPAAHFLGATSGAVRARAEGPLLIFGMGLTPCGWAAMMGGDASLLLDRVVDAEAAIGPAVPDVVAQLAAAEGVAAMAAVAEPLVRALVAGGDGGALGLMHAVDSWLSDGVSPEVEELVAATGLSRRQLERRCNALYGAPPKVLARKYRAMRAAVALAQGQAAFETFVAEAFYDQSHLIREFKRFVGLTPRQLRADPSLLGRLTADGHLKLEGQVPAVVSRT
jgi:AraC-like DNA-binding protein